MEIESSSSSAKKNEKIGKVLQKFLQPTFKVRNDVYINLFFTHLMDKNDNAYIWQKDEQLKEQFCQWIIEASNLWDQHKGNPQALILSFTLSLVSQLSADEHIFVELNCQNVYESLVGVAQTNSVKNPIVTLGLVNLLCSFLEHKSGIQWVMATTHWMDMINLGLKGCTMGIRKKAYQFIIKLLEKTISFNRNFVVNVVRLLVKPLKDAFQSLPSDKNTELKEVESRQIFESLKPCLNLLLKTVETILKSFNEKVMRLFFEQKTSEIIEKFLLLSTSEDFSFELLRIQFVFLFDRLIEKVNGMKVIDHDALPLFGCRLMFDLIKNEMDKNNVRCVVKICDFAHEIFSCLAHRMPKFIKKGHIIEFQTQVMFLQIMPIFSLSIQMRTYEQLNHLLINDVFRNTFFRKWLKISTVQSIEICYKWDENLKTKPDLVDDVIFCLEYIVKMKKLLNKERAATIFPALVFSLTDAISCLKETQKTELAPSCFLFLKTLVETMIDLVESFDLTWTDSVETICVLDLAYDFLLYPHWTDKTIIVNGLKLLNTAISKNMSPDMVLLIYHKENSKVSQTGSLLYAKCHDSSWEIRNTALEVVCTLSLNANTKFPAYTHILVKAEFPQLVMDMARKDAECYVRSTAFRCLQELIQIPQIWDILLNMDSFLDNILNVFENEPEGIVRKEAATLISRIDKLQNFPKEILSRLYDVMTHAAIGDLHWEVKFNALDFWLNLWEQHLIHQGMIDHTFPSHTFSKEHKKIVALNDAEVRKRIIKVLNQLSHIGCLHVMKCAFQDDCDIEVSKKATTFTFSMLKMLKMYKIHCENVDMSQPPSPAILQQESLPSRPFFEPVSPASSCTMTASSPASIRDLESPQLRNSPFFEPLTPLPAPCSPSLDIGLMTPPESAVSTTQNSPQENRVPLQDTSSSRRQSDSCFSNTLSNQITSSLNLTNGTDAFGYEESSFDTGQLDNIVDSNCYDPVRREQTFVEFLKSNDAAFLQGNYNPAGQVNNNATQMKTKTYLSPSQYLKFIYNELETHTMEKTQWMNSLDVLDCLLDDILKDDDIVADVNSMDY